MEPKFQLKKSRTSYLSVDYSHILKDTPRTDYSTTASQVLTPNPSSFSVYSQEPKYKPLVLKEDSKDRILTELEDKIAKLFKVVSNKANQVNKAWKQVYARSQTIQSSKLSLIRCTVENEAFKEQNKLYQVGNSKENTLIEETKEVELWEEKIVEEEQKLENELKILDASYYIMKEQAVRRTLMSNLANIETVLEKIEDKFSGLTATSGNLKSELRTLNYKLKSIYLELQIPESKLKQRQTLIKDTEQKQQENNVYSHKIHGMKSLLIDITEKKANSLKELQVLQESYILLDQNINTKRQSLISRKKNHELNISEINRASEAILESKLDIDERNQILGRALCYLEERLVKIKIGEEKLIDVERVLSEKVKNNNDEKDKYRTPASRKNVETLNQKISEISIKEMKIKKLEKQRELKKLE